MFTIEMEDEETKITLLDTTGYVDDVTISMNDKYVFVQQWNDDIDSLDEIILTSEMYYKLMQAWQLPAGTYTMETKNANT